MELIDTFENNQNQNIINNTAQTEKLVIHEEIDLGENHVFNTSWDIWYHHSLNDWSIGGYKRIFPIDNIKTFWDFHNNINCLGGITNLNFFMMRRDITPIWEDLKNRNGGCWSILVPLINAYTIWEELAILMVGENLVQDSVIITGLSINVKSNTSVIKIWNNNRSYNDAKLLPSFLKQYGNIIYRNHQLDY